MGCDGLIGQGRAYVHTLPCEMRRLLAFARGAVDSSREKCDRLITVSLDVIFRTEVIRQSNVYLYRGRLKMKH